MLNNNVKINNMNEFNNFTNHLYDVIFEETSNYLSDCVGNHDWDEELHEAHGVIMYNAVELLAKRFGIIKK